MDDYLSLKLRPDFNFKPTRWKSKVWYIIWPKTGGLLQRFVPEMTYYVSNGTLNLAKLKLKTQNSAKTWFQIELMTGFQSDHSCCEQCSFMPEFNSLDRLISVAASVLSCPLRHVIITRSSATAKSTARPSCLVGVLYDIYRETDNRSTANQPLVQNWPWNLPNSAK